MNLDTGAGNQNFTCSWIWGVSKGESKCPPFAKIWQDSVDTAWTITYTLDDEDGFYVAVESIIGITKDWIQFAEYDQPWTCANEESDRVGGGNHPCKQTTNKRLGFPQKADDIIISNPKDVTIL